MYIGFKRRVWNPRGLLLLLVLVAEARRLEVSIVRVPVERIGTTVPWRFFSTSLWRDTEPEKREKEIARNMPNHSEWWETVSSVYDRERERERDPMQRGNTLCVTSRAHCLLEWVAVSAMSRAFVTNKFNDVKWSSRRRACTLPPPPWLCCFCFKPQPRRRQTLSSG